jgi:acyl carrier protein
MIVPNAKTDIRNFHDQRNLSSADCKGASDMNDYKTRIRAFIIENFLFGEANGLNDDTSLLEEGIIDSTGVLELVEFLESEFSINVEDEELIPENLDSINNTAKYLAQKVM